MIRKPKSGTGCGTGCLSLIIILVLFFAGSYFYIKHRLASLEKIDESDTRLETVYGSVYDFTPELENNYNSLRVARFLEVRSSITAEIAGLDSAMLKMQSEIEGVVEDPSFWDALIIIKGGFELIPEIVGYYLSRNEALIDHQMGLGEYNYIYYTAYYVVLDKSPRDGPKFRLEGEGSDQDERYGETVFDDRMVKIYITDPSNPYLPIIEEEISRLLSDRNLLPWSSNKPEFVTAPFQDHISELSNSYKPLLNPLEVSDK
jgi:hypothetical protein